MMQNDQQLLARMTEYYHDRLRVDERGIHYLEERGITDPLLYDQFMLGFADGTLFDIVPRKGEVVDRLKAIGLITPKGKEFLAGCVVFPIRDSSGTVVNLYGRRITDHQDCFLLNNTSGVWNQDCLGDQDTSLLVETPVDALLLHQAGYKNAIACTAGQVTDDHIAAFRLNNTREIIVVSPNGGHADTIQTQLKDIACHAVKQAEPLERLITQKTPDQLEALIYGSSEGQGVSSREELEDGFALQICRRRYVIRGIDCSNNRLKITIRAINHKRHHIDTLDLYSHKARVPLVKAVTQFFQTDIESIERDIARIITETESFIQQREDSQGVIKVDINEQDKTAAQQLGKQADLARQIVEDLTHCGYVGEDTNKLLCYLAMTSRKMEDPLSVLILSGSGAGKSSLQDTVLNLCPPEDLLKLTSLTGKALFYKQELSLKNKVLAIAEAEGAEDADYAIRNLISSKELVIESTVKDAVTGKLSTMTNRVACNTSVFKTTTNAVIHPETQNRFITVSVDESASQTQRILEYQRFIETREGFAVKSQRGAIVEKHRNFQRLLKPLLVFNPFAPQLTYIDDRLQVRRDHNKYLSIIKTVAFLHQLQREIKHLEDGTEYIEVTLQDIEIANDIFHHLYGNTLDELSEPSRQLLKLIHTMVTELAAEFEIDKRQITFTRRQIREYARWSDYQVKTHVRQLVDLEYLGVIHGRKGQQFQYCLYYDGEGRDGSTFIQGLKSVKQLRREARWLQSV